MRTASSSRAPRQWRVARLWRCLAALLILGTGTLSSSLRAQTDNDLDELVQQIGQLYRQGRYQEATALAEQRAAITLQRYGNKGVQRAGALNDLGHLYEKLGRLREAEETQRSALALFEAEPSADAEIAVTLNNLGLIYRAQGRLADAEATAKRSLTYREKSLPPEHPEIARGLNNLALVYEAQARLDEAEPMFQRALQIWEKESPPRYDDIALAIANLAILYKNMGRQAEAEQHYRRSLELRRQHLPARHPDIPIAMNNLAVFLETQGRFPESEDLKTSAVALFEQHLPSGHPYIAQSINNLAILHRQQGRLADAERMQRRAMAMLEQSYPRSHRTVVGSRYNLAVLLAMRDDWPQALSKIAEATAPFIDSAVPLAGQQRDFFAFHVEALRRNGPEREAAAPQAFALSQWATRSEAATVLGQLSARLAAGDGQLSVNVRRHQDLLLGARHADRELNLALASGRSEQIAEARRRLEAITAEQAAAEKDLIRHDPKYGTLVDSSPLAIERIRELLEPNEALVQIMEAPALPGMRGGLHVWTLTKDAPPAWTSAVPARRVAESVAALRCGLDEEEWVAQSSASRCLKLLGLANEQPDPSRPLPFHLGIAHELYRVLFGEAEELIKGKRLLIVASGALGSLPFHVLVTEKPTTDLPNSFEAYRHVSWLAQHHAMAVLPSVSSLEALRNLRSAARATRDYIGVGNPVLTGDGGACRIPKSPAGACPSSVSRERGSHALIADEANSRATVRGRGGRRGADLGRFYAKGNSSAAVIEQVRALCPLPDTEYEIRCVSQRFDSGSRIVRLDHSATEAEIKKLSEEGVLEQYRIVHIATHGLLAGDVEVMANRQGEPALVLTPPTSSQDAHDNGLLTASEVSRLRLNADWVVLSACNTAAGDKLGAEALTGLARAFFYAHARALLVSHWPVYSDAAVALTTRAFAELDARPDAGRAEALQAAMTALIRDHSQRDNAHPSVWAPFVVVGEGAR